MDRNLQNGCRLSETIQKRAHMHKPINTYIHIYIEREREGDREIEEKRDKMSEIMCSLLLLSVDCFI